MYFFLFCQNPKKWPKCGPNNLCFGPNKHILLQKSHGKLKLAKQKMFEIIQVDEFFVEIRKITEMQSKIWFDNYDFSRKSCHTKIYQIAGERFSYNNGRGGKRSSSCRLTQKMKKNDFLRFRSFSATFKKISSDWCSNSR